jgi:hypothetical protein
MQHLGLGRNCPGFVPLSFGSNGLQEFAYAWRLGYKTWRDGQEDLSGPVSLVQEGNMQSRLPPPQEAFLTLEDWLSVDPRILLSL